MVSVEGTERGRLLCQTVIFQHVLVVSMSESENFIYTREIAYMLAGLKPHTYL